MTARDGHVCLACGCRIGNGEAEIAVPSRSGAPSGTRYRHGEDEDCQAALGRADGRGNTARIGWARDI